MNLIVTDSLIPGTQSGYLFVMYTFKSKRFTTVQLKYFSNSKQDLHIFEIKKHTTLDDCPALPW